MRLRKQTLIAMMLLGFGLLPLPVMVYWVGTQVVGPYEAEGGLWALVGNVWGDLTSGNPLAWILVLSPYLIIQLLRLARKRYRDDVSAVRTRMS